MGIQFHYLTSLTLFYSPCWLEGHSYSEVSEMLMLVVVLRGRNCGSWSHLGCSGWKANIFTHKDIQVYG